jgi:hypothetical protein
VRVQIADGTKLPAQVTVEATATPLSAKQPLHSLQLLLNGRPATVTNHTITYKDPIPPGSEGVKQTWTVKLPPGEHQIAILARGTDTLGSSEPLEVVGPKASARLHVLAAGVSKYKNDGKGEENKSLNLTYAAKDAAEIYAVIQKRCVDDKLFAKGEMPKPLLDEAATAANILAELRKLADGTKVKSGDLVIVYFSGHGERDDAGKLYLLTHETDRANLGSTALSGEKLKAELAKIPCKVLLLLDACHSTAIGPRKKSATDDLTRMVIDEDCAVAVLAAAMGKEFALEGIKDDSGQLIKNGLFTYALREALEGKAEADRDGLVFIHDVYQHVFKRVRDLSERKQNPFMALPWSVKPFPVEKREVASESSSK